MSTIDQNQNAPIEEESTYVSDAVIRRLPRYFRYLRILMRNGKMRVSSGELAAMMHITASQIRQDLNCFGGFGQQGYGYNVSFLYAKICDLLGVGAGITAVVIGAGDLGRALVRSSMFAKRGVDILSLFDINPALIGHEFGGVTVRWMDDLESFCKQNEVKMAVLTLPKDQAEAVASRLIAIGIKGIWNFTGKELHYDDPEIIVEEVHLGDSLMALNYRLCRREAAKQEETGAN